MANLWWWYINGKRTEYRNRSLLNAQADMGHILKDWHRGHPEGITSIELKLEDQDNV